MTTVILSPHFDDAVYSCGGAIHHWTAQGDTVMVITVMGGSIPELAPDTPIVRDLHARWSAGADPIPTRRAEDQQAVALIGAGALHWSVPDCIYRVVDGVALYPTEASLWGAIHPKDSIARFLTQAPDAAFWGTVSRVVAPLGVGSHVDHRLVRAWAQDHIRRYPHMTLEYFTDYPYMKNTARITAALAEHPQRLAPHWQRLTLADMEAKLAAMAQYSSQVSSFWADMDHMRADVVESFRQSDGLWGECYWSRA